jgi:glycosyltransferase involved in cell wall biosynthesis
LKKSHSIIAVSDFIKRDLSTAYSAIISPEKIISIPHGKPAWKSNENFNEKNRDQFVFFVGSTEPRKNLLNLLKALEILSETGQIVPLHIAGPHGWKNKEFYQFVQKSSIRNQIRFLGYCSDEELIHNYSTCKAFIYPSFYEGFGLPVLEALNFDSLVLTSRGTVMEEIAGPAALYFNPEDPGDIARIIGSLFSASFNRLDVMKYKNEVLEKYSWEKSAVRLLEALIN